MLKKPKACFNVDARGLVWILGSLGLRIKLLPGQDTRRHLKNRIWAQNHFHKLSTSKAGPTLRLGSKAFLR
jgi:hypothetical protein